MPTGGAAAGIAGVFAGAATAATTAAITSVAITVAITTSVSIGASFALAALQSTPADQDIGAIKDTQIFSSEEGSPIYRCLGERCRVGGTVLWVGKLEYYEQNEHILGVKISKKIYQRDIAIGICHGPISKISRVIANGIIISADPGEVSVTHTGFHVEPRTQDEYPGWTQIFDIFGIGIMRIHMGKDLIAPPLQNLEDFQPGGQLTTLGQPGNGFNSIFNNGTVIPGTPMYILGTGVTVATDPWFIANPVATSDLIAAGGSHFVDVLNPSAQIEHHQVEPGTDPLLITIKSTNENFTRFTTGRQYYDDIDFQLGEEDQDVHGALNAKNFTKFGGCYPAYRGLAYVYIKNLRLLDFGDQIPPIEFEIEEQSGRSVGSTIAKMLELGGLVENEYIIDTVLNSIEMRGYVIPGPTPMNKALLPLMRAFNVAVQETNEGRLRFMKRNAGVEWTIVEDDLAAHELGTTIPRPLEITDVPDDSLPEQVNISYVDTSLDLQKGSQRERRINLTNRNIMKLDIPVTLEPADARAIAARELWLAVINRQKVNLFLPPSYLLIKENDILKITADSNDYTILVTKVERGNNFLMAIEGYLESEELMDFENSPGEDGTDPPPINGLPVILPFVIDKGSPISSAHWGEYGFYIALFNITPQIPVGTINVFISIDEPPEEDGSNIFHLTVLSFASDWGTALDLPSSTSRHGVWDTESSVTIKMQQGVIGTASENTVYQGVNWAMLGKEVIAYKTVTSQSDGTVKITNLLRGLRDTEDEISTHELVSSNPNDPGTGTEIFMPLRGDNYNFIAPLPPELDGKTIHIGAAPAGAEAIGVFWFDPFVYFGHSAKPWRVNNLEIRKAFGTNTVRISWAHATAKHYSPFTQESTPPFLPDREFYQIVILVSGVEKRVENRIFPYWLYNTVDQTDDDIIPGSTTFTVEVYERANNGRSLIHSGVYVP